MVAVSGESGRSTFLTAKGFDIHPGFKDLLGGVGPLLPFRCGYFTDHLYYADPHGQGSNFRPTRKDHRPYLSTAGHGPDASKPIKSYVKYTAPPEPLLILTH